MTEEEINKERNDDFLELLEKTNKIKSQLEIYPSKLKNGNTDKNISEKIYTEHFLMSSVLDAFMFRESLNLKELFEIVLNQKIPKYFIWKVSINKINATIIEMIKLGYIELYKENDTKVPIFLLTELGITILQQRTLQNLALTSFYSYQSYKLNKKAIYLSLIALGISVIAIVISIIIAK